jgi:hypothetical protein
MKKALLMLVLVLTFVSCGGGKYDRAIADYEQTIENTKVDLKFKIIDSKELKSISVGDSINFCEKEGALMLENAKLDYDRELSKFEKDSIFNVSTYPDHAEQLNETGRALLKTIKDKYDHALGFENYWKNLYKDREPTEVLRVVVECKYSIQNPLLNNAEQEITNTYVMSPDGTICYGRIDKND